MINIQLYKKMSITVVLELYSSTGIRSLQTPMVAEKISFSFLVCLL